MLLLFFDPNWCFAFSHSTRSWSLSVSPPPWSSHLGLGKRQSAFQESLESVLYLLQATFLSSSNKLVQRRKITLPDSSASWNPTSSAFKVILNRCFWLVSFKAAENDGAGGKVIQISPISSFTGSAFSDTVCVNGLFETEEGCGICFTEGRGDWWVQ